MYFLMIQMNGRIQDGDGVGDNSDECEGFDDNIEVLMEMVFVNDVMIFQMILPKQLILMETV